MAGTSLSTARRANLFLKIGIAILAVAFALYPVVWIISASLNPANSLLNLSIIPEPASLANFERLVSDPQYPFPLWIWNSIKVAAITSVLTVFLTALAAYSFSRFRYKGRRTGLLVILLIQLFPNSLAIVSLFLLLQQIGNIPGLSWFGLNTHGGLILIYAGGALGFNTWLMKGFFDSIPKELDEVANIDGATKWQVFWSIILPLARPILVVIGILTFIGTYGEFLIARVILKGTENYTLMVGLFLFNSGRAQEWGVITAASLVGALPAVILFFVTQRLLVSGLSSGAVKG
ncbi:MAG TPA: sugar ABC transporter permease [Chthoniobacterales bacterium]